METKKTQKFIHSVNILEKQKVEVVGVVEVLSSTDKEVAVKLEDSFMYIFGSGMTVSKLSPEEEFLVVSGNISGLKYEEKRTKKSFFGKVFK
jgi:hypothetical protein